MLHSDLGYVSGKSRRVLHAALYVLCVVCARSLMSLRACIGVFVVHFSGIINIK